MPTTPASPDRSGFTGLGLQIVRRTVAAVNGEMTIDRDGPGTTIRVLLPAAPASAWIGLPNGRRSGGRARR